ncbi:MAG: lipocalin-like domain-containing protein [Vicinamibacterales bacterium]
MSNRFLRLAAVLVVLTAFGSAVPGARQEGSSIRARLLGHWRLVSTETLRDGDPPRLTLGATPVGMISYTDDGHMLVHLADPARPKTRVADASAAETRELLRTHSAYFGTFTVDEAARTVTHHRDGSSTPGERDFVRAVEFLGNRLVLTTPDTVSEGRKQHGRITWERLGPAPAVAPFVADARRAVVGTWELVEHKTTMANGEVRRNYGTAPKGLFVFSADGRATVQILDSTRPSTPAASASDDDVKALMRTYLAYFGTFDVDPAKHMITVHTTSDLNPANTGADQIRFYEIEGDTMYLQPPAASNGSQSRITWRRVGGR